MLMRNVLVTLIALAVAAYLGGILFGPGDDLSTWQWLGFMVIGLPAILGLAALLGGPTGSQPREECEAEDPQAT